jgi:hypothetical protein
MFVWLFVNRFLLSIKFVNKIAERTVRRYVEAAVRLAGAVLNDPLNVVVGEPFLDSALPPNSTIMGESIKRDVIKSVS